MNDINDIAAEAAVLASIIQNPDMYFIDTGLEPKHFFEEQNNYLYFALSQLVKKGRSVDAFNIMQILSQSTGTKHRSEQLLSIAAINDFIGMSPSIARRTEEDYRLAAESVIEKALKREMYGALTELQNLCLSDQYQEDFEQEVYARLDGIIKDYTSNSDMAELKDSIDEIWDGIQARKRGDIVPIRYPFETLNSYILMDPSVVTAVAAPKKMGKSMFLTTICTSLLTSDYSILYIDSELSDETWVKRVLSNVTKIPFSKLKYGTYDAEEEARLIEAKEWLKTRKIVHKYLPILDSQGLSLAAKRGMYVLNGYDVLILDYLKADSRSDEAYANYSALGRVADTLKEIAGSMKIPVVCACQATDNGKIADSAKIARNVDSVITITQKTREEIERDGPECGNRKLFVYANRNGPQMGDESEYIDLIFEGDICTYREGKQHQIEVPY